ncbi:riboflavin biosynthesis protein RibF [Weissella muntiaci]|uniref:Riboflavin biosynthesis protein n=1 Tax=Weissella muntiaci TaxID=2508881 RepID=A0A6C2C4F0_9LACO|nr:riboflavin biosynthesis protein RibF [Weissella muntiaci]TYC48215.1 riboflavin biosynthesis protein RibF [Weissella muntiaci]
MEVIYLHHPFRPDEIKTDAVVLAMGFFDGLHLGHQAVIERARIEAERRHVPLAVLTYDQHASVVFKQHTERLTYLTTIEKKQALLADMGVDLMYIINFTSNFAKLTPQQFVNQYIVEMHTVAAVAGFDHTYGPKDANMAHLAEYAQNRFDVIEVPAVAVDGIEGASTSGRMFVDRGDVTSLNKLLGRVYETSGVVVHGEARGREMGFPTANIEAPSDERLPGVGIYIVELAIGGNWHQGMASIGYNVTFGDNRPKTVEINLFDFKEEIYGEAVSVRWHKYLRGEVKFTGMPALIEQLHDDERQARRYFKEKE